MSVLRQATITLHKSTTGLSHTKMTPIQETAALLRTTGFQHLVTKDPHLNTSGVHHTTGNLSCSATDIQLTTPDHHCDVMVLHHSTKSLHCATVYLHHATKDLNPERKNKISEHDQVLLQTIINVCVGSMGWNGTWRSFCGRAWVRKAS